MANFVVVGLIYSESCAIAALIDILMDVLDSLHGCAYLDVNMSAVLTGEVRVIGNNPAVIEMDDVAVTT